MKLFLRSSTPVFRHVFNHTILTFQEQIIFINSDALRGKYNVIRTPEWLFNLIIRSNLSKEQTEITKDTETRQPSDRTQKINEIKFCSSFMFPNCNCVQAAIRPYLLGAKWTILCRGLGVRLVPTDFGTFFLYRRPYQGYPFINSWH